MLIELNIDKIRLAEWNYKEAGDERKLAKLRKSIEKHNTYGTIFVREIDDCLYECIDGNHRVYVLKEMGFTTITVFNFGKISKEDAVEKALAFNTKRFDTDILKLAELFDDLELDIHELESTTGFEMEELTYIDEFNKIEFRTAEPIKKDTQKVTLTVKFSEVEAKYIKEKASELGIKEKDYILKAIALDREE